MLKFVESGAVKTNPSAKDADMGKMKKIYECGRVDGLRETEAFFSLIREMFPEISAFMDSHELVNEKIFRNECYAIYFGRRKTTLFLNKDVMAV